MAVASLVLGIVSLVWSLIGGTFLSAVVALIGIILGVQGRKDPNNRGMATAGFVCSLIALVFSLIGVVACAGLGVFSAFSNTNWHNLSF